MTSTDRELVEARKARVAALTWEGKSAREIAAILGISDRTVVRLRRSSGCSGGPAEAREPLPADYVAKAEAMLEDGCSYKEVARTLGCSHVWVARRFPGRGWTRSQGAAFANVIRWAGR